MASASEITAIAVNELAEAESHVLDERLHLGPFFSMRQAGYVATGTATEGGRELTAAQSAGALEQIADHECPERQDV
jgi:hypothetical protein